MSADVRRRRAVRVATAAWLIGWYWKAWFYVAHLREAAALPIDIEALPTALRAPWIAAVAYGLPLAAGAALCFGGRRVRMAGAAALALAAGVACAHVETFNDATFMTSFWTSLWIAWLVTAPDAELAPYGPRLARAVVALVFLGGVVGKLTPAYTSGDAFYHLYFLQKDSWPYPALRLSLDDSTLRAVAMWLSLAVLIGEAALALGPVLPHRAYVRAACAMMLGMVVISTFYLVSVLACLAGVLVASSALVRERPAAAATAAATAATG